MLTDYTGEYERVNIMIGIDISKWNGGIDFTRVKASGIDFVIIRAGFGVSGIDPLFKANYNAAKAAGLHIGAYWYSYACTKSYLDVEIKAFLKAIQGMKFEMPIYWDIEEGWVIDNINYVIPTVCNALENAGYFAGYYTSASVNASVTEENKKRYTSWIAHWGKKAGTYKPLHQYSSTGEISGINGNVDLDFCSVNFPAIITAKKLNNIGINTSDNKIKDAIDKINAGVNILEKLQ